MHELPSSPHLSSRLHGRRECRFSSSKWIMVLPLILKFQSLHYIKLLTFSKSHTLLRIGLQGFKYLALIHRQLHLLFFIILSDSLSATTTAATAWGLINRLPCVLPFGSAFASLDLAKWGIGRGRCCHLGLPPLLLAGGGHIGDGDPCDVAQQDPLWVVVLVLVQQLGLVAIETQVLQNVRLAILCAVLYIYLLL